ncbi:hypothetical protein [Streptomyces sp. NPDC050848]|uniref:hypothetical protein n=1 Tax=Streptomyces sp. NPDC050848 TaxID=3155791 RepID=UPI0033EF92A1
MAADTAPAAVPDPNDRTHQAGRPGLLTSMLAPVEPARPAPAAFTLDPAAVESPAPQNVAGVSSASFHGDENTPGNATNSTGQQRKKESVIRAWLLAGAERWKKGAGTAVKRLEVEKARAMAQQVKETRTVTVNRTPPSPKASGSGAAGGGKGPAKTPKNASSGSGTGPKNTAPGGGATRTKTPTPAPAPGPAKTAPAPKASKAPKAPSPAADRPASTTSSPKRDPGTVKPQKTNGPGKSGSGPGTSPTPKSEGRGGDPATRKPAKDRSTTGGKAEPKPGKATADADQGPAKSTAGKPSTDKVNLLKKKPNRAGEERPAEPAATKPAPQDASKPSDGKPDKTTGTTRPGEPSTAPAGKTLGTRGSRETGYRDGARVARAVAHANAYRDGVVDGWTDVQEAARQEKTELDTAHAARQQQRDKDTTPVPPTQTVPPQPTYAPAVPIPVTGIDASSVHLGDGTNRTALARSEVRTLKSFERRLEAKKGVMQDVAERSRGLETHATQQAEAVTRLLEVVKGVKGGEKLLSTLVRLEDAAKAQAAQAGEVNLRAVRGADAAGAAYANAQIRYGAIYQAVVDSDETKPAELRFYKEG